MEERVDRRFQDSGVPLNLGQEKASLERREKGDGEGVGVGAVREPAGPVQAAQVFADGGLPLPEAVGQQGPGVRVGLRELAGERAESATEAEFDQPFTVNVKVPFFLVASLAPAMAARGHGAIVSTSTMVASFGQPGMAAYGASRAALELLTKAWAAEYGPRGVRVNAVAPGPTRTR